MNDHASNRKAVAILVMVVTPLCFATNVVLCRHVIADVSPATLAFLRWAAVAVLLSPFLLRDRVALSNAARRSPELIALLGFLGMVICGAGVYFGLARTTATNGNLIYSTSPVIILLLDAAIRGRPISWREAVGSFIAFAGVVAIILRGDLAVLSSLDFNLGDLVFVGAAFAWAVYSIFYRSPGLDGVSNMGLFSAVALAGAAMLLPLAIAEQAMGGIMPGSLNAWVSIAGIVLVASILAFSGFQYGVRALGSSVAGIFMYLLPGYGAVLAVLFLGERFETYHLAGLALIMAGVVLATFPVAWLSGRGRRGDSAEHAE